MKVTFTVVCEDVDGDIAADDFSAVLYRLEMAAIDFWPAFVSDPGAVECTARVDP